MYIFVHETKNTIMSNRLIVLIITILSSTMIFSGCTKVEENIEGMWLLESMKAEPREKCIWNFTSNQELIITYYNLGEAEEDIIYVDSAYYTIEKELTYSAIKIVESEGVFMHPPMNGFFRVDKSTDNMLVLTRYKWNDETTDASYLRREFTRLD